jgi:F-type H+-transporting ATPase subunit gamma
VPNTLDIRRRIRSVKNTQQITRAMKMVAAAKLRRAQESIVAARPYSGALQEILSSVATRVDPEQHPLLREREEKRVLIVVVTGDKGLCGAFNTKIVTTTQREIAVRDWESVQLIPIGRKGADFFKRREIPIRHQAINVFQALAPETAKALAKLIVDDYVEEKIDAVYVVYNEFRSVIMQIVRFEKLLPLTRAEVEEPTIDYLYEPSPDEILRNLLPKYVEFQVYRTLLDSAAAEQGARMTAMEAATRNAGDMIDSLTLTYNRARQAAITKEIIEIVSGAAALE